MRKNQILSLALCCGVILFAFSCKHEPPTAAGCDQANLTLSVSKTDATTGNNNGSISATASGGNGITYTLGTTTNSTGQFSNLSAGPYTVTAKNTEGCIKTAPVIISTVTASLPCTGTVPSGPNFTNVRTIIKANCGGSNCHLNGGNRAGFNFDTDCKIESNWSAINNACVINQTMPPSGLSQTQMDQITAWVNAGHKYTD